jgi:hypothetical protein
MIQMRSERFDLDVCERNVDEFADFLRDNPTIAETGPGSLKEFFHARPQLIMLMGISIRKLNQVRFQTELSIFGEFFADYAICDGSGSRYLFVEFEDATEESIFAVKTRGRANTSFRWSQRFEAGFSQLVDWHFRIDDYRRTSKIREHFGQDDIEYEGLLVIGRRAFVDAAGGAHRLRWRRERTMINHKYIYCMTFDDLLDELRNGVDVLKNIRDNQI